MSPAGENAQSHLGRISVLVYAVSLFIYTSRAFAQVKQAPITGSVNTPTLRDSCPNYGLSCRNSSVVEDLCCFHAPGGLLLLTQFWDSQPAVGPDDSWTLHGLWPDFCDGSYEANCDDSRNYKDIARILEDAHRHETLRYMEEFWLDQNGNGERLWQHEWGKHGTCISTLSPACFSDYSRAMEVPIFFDRAVELFKSLPAYTWLKEAGIEPSTTTTYTAAQIKDALSRFGGEVRLGCRNGILNELWFYYLKRGSMRDSGGFVPSDSLSASTCPSHQIRYLPKHRAPISTTTRSGSKPTSKPTPGKPFVGRGQLTVVVSGNTRGCIISAGAWYATGTCASFTASKHNETFFTLKSSKGSCGIENSELLCGQRMKPSLFEASDSTLLFNGSDTFYADNMAKGRKKSPIFVDSGHNIDVQIHWRH